MSCGLLVTFTAADSRHSICNGGGQDCSQGAKGGHSKQW